MSQAELADAIRERGVLLHPSAIAKIEARDAPSPRTVRLNEAEAIARALGKPLADMVSGPEQIFDQAAFLAEMALDHKRQMDEYWEEVFALILTLKDAGFDPSKPTPEIQRYRQRIVSSLAEMAIREFSEEERRSAERTLDEYGWESDGEHSEAG